MNTNFLAIIKRIVTEQGETILTEPRRLKGWISDYAKDEPKAERLAFGRCIEAGAYGELKNAPDAAARQAVKAALARRVNANEAIDIAFCNDALDVLEAALFGEEKPEKALCPTCGRELAADTAVCPFCAAKGAAAPAAGYGYNCQAGILFEEGAVMQESYRHRARDFLILRILSILVFFMFLDYQFHFVSWPIFGFTSLYHFAGFGFALGLAIFACIIGRKYQIKSITVMSIIGLITSLWLPMAIMANLYGSWGNLVSFGFSKAIFPLFTLVQSIRKKNGNLTVLSKAAGKTSGK